MTRLSSRIREQPSVGCWIAASISLVASAPGLKLPFLSDDWALVAAAQAGSFATTPFRDFRPLFSALYWIDRKTWGASAAGFHLTNMLLIALAAALVVRVVHRWTDEPGLATMTGVLFALHPYHVENAAWIAGRSDALLSVFYLLALLRFETWRESGKGLPWGAMVLAEAALLSKESALTLGLILSLRCFVIPDSTERRRLFRHGVLPILVLTCSHLLILRPLVLSGLGRTLTSSFGLAWLKDACGMAAATIVPLEAERLSFRPWLWGLVAVGSWLFLVLSATRASRSLPRIALPAACAFCILIVPNVVGFQERYMFLPVAASSLAVVTLARASGPRLGMGMLILILSAWTFLSVGHWHDWREAARTSEVIVHRLAEESVIPSVNEIVIANVPHRILGASVAGDFEAAIGVLGARRVPVRGACWVAYPSARAVALASPPEWVEDGDRVTLRLDVTPSPFRRYLGPSTSSGTPSIPALISLQAEGPDVVRVTLQTAPGRSILYWEEGALHALASNGVEAFPRQAL